MSEDAHQSIGEVLSLLKEEHADVTISKIDFNVVVMTVESLAQQGLSFHFFLNVKTEGVQIRPNNQIGTLATRKSKPEFPSAKN